MSWQFVYTLWGPDIVNTAPKCRIQGCDNYADNAGYGNYHHLCSSHHKGKYLMNDWVYKQHRKDYCENIDGRLGFVCTTTIVAPNWMLEVDHKDGDNENNNPKNLQTLCACCHRYKTMLNEENLPKNKRKKFLENLHFEELKEAGYFDKEVA
jgi:hypothetical protein